MDSSTGRQLRTPLWIALALCAGFMISACGGGSSSGNPSASADDPGGGQLVAEGRDVPSEASGSVASMLAWVKSLGASETTEPYRLDNFRPPLDETTETSPG